MKHFRKILATTDLSPASLSTLRYAVHLANAQNASLVVLYVPPLPVVIHAEILPPLDLTALTAEVEQKARKRLEHWAKRYAPQLPIEVLVKLGVVHETILAVARQVGANLIVMSTHGRKGVRHLLLGSITERVLREAPCPVLVVRPTHGAKAARSRSDAGRSKKAA